MFGNAWIAKRLVDQHLAFRLNKDRAGESVGDLLLDDVTNVLGGVSSECERAEQGNAEDEADYRHSEFYGFAGWQVSFTPTQAKAACVGTRPI